MTPAGKSQTEFQYPLLVAQTFDEILASDGVPCELSDISALIRKKGQAILQARGGAGKSVTALRIAETERASGVILLPALALYAENASNWARLDIDMLASLSGDDESARLVGERMQGLVIIDGINEIPKDRADYLLLQIPLLTARYPFVQFLVTDRLTRRDVDTDVWLLATLGPVPDDVARTLLRTYIKDIPEYLTVPYYLDHSINRGGPQSQVAILREGLTTHGGVPDELVVALASNIFDQYKKRHDRATDSHTIIQAVGTAVFDEMVSSDLLRRDGDRVQFAHHLIQDYLAATHLSKHDNLWGPTGFDVVTLKASSFDGLALAAGLIEPRRRVDEFVHRVFDWNYYGAAYILEDDATGEKRILEAMRTAILAMLAEKRFDKMIVTARRVEDALRLQDDPLAYRLLKAGNREEVVHETNDALPQEWESQWPVWFREWYDTFKRPSRVKATDSDVGKITSETGTVGWAASNMLKRLDTSEKLREIVMNYAAAHKSPTIRWRAVHTLGAWPTNKSIDVLLSRVADSSEEIWVRYGALRSILEAAASSTRSVRRRVFQALGEADLAREIAAQPQLRKEAIRALEVADMPRDWHAAAGAFLDHLWASSDDPLDRDEVLLLAQRLRAAQAAI